MLLRPRHLVAALAAVATLVSVAPSDAAFLPVGAGTWASTNVSGGSGCFGSGVGTTPCVLTADSKLPTAAPTNGKETCTNATQVVGPPIVVGTDFQCHVVFSGQLNLTGTGGNEEVGDPQSDTDVVIEVGACAGFTLVGPYIDVTDGAFGTIRVYPNVVVTNAAWKIDGNFVGVNVGTGSVVVLHVVATITPGCKRVKVRKGETTTQFAGLFKGSYQTL